MIEFDIDMEYCMDELDSVVIHDEFGELPDMMFVPDAPEKTCKAVSMDCLGNPPYNNTGVSCNDSGYGCSECGYPWHNLNLGSSRITHKVKACPNCGLRVRE